MCPAGGWGERQAKARDWLQGRNEVGSLGEFSLGGQATGFCSTGRQEPNHWGKPGQGQKADPDSNQRKKPKRSQLTPMMLLLALIPSMSLYGFVRP